MKKYIQSFGYIGFVVITFIGLTKAFTTYEDPFDIYENPLVWLALIGFVLVVVMKEMVNLIAQKKADELQREKDGIEPEPSNAWWKKLMEKWTKSKAIEEEDEIVLDHNYDGIRELDNTLPPWWVYMFYATILFAAIYLVKYEIMGGDDQETEYRKEVAAAELELKKYKETTPDAFDITKIEARTDQGSLKRGNAVFRLNCASCHAADGGGGIGPNLTDKNWILGGGIQNVFKTISDGGRPGKGMIAWKKTLKPQDIEKVASYILSLQGTSPAKPKKAEGDIWEEN
ncbi:cbb3-type cytochrome c oxidase N-terminal domain-containing protein [Flavobacteriaceae bacterium S356]|uniref:Cbb3-type cytochrome c oxidase N-terminal domain-containing protein n=1 Tax=Asprobacillus argus TaxID=3076534 RepID=A0ABU3LI06_9FLAO|nr:cbb3-type cytochrome c oxidase N-terminal domain-containing protein [Flavobacteriaceae bacterium S356]